MILFVSKNIRPILQRVYDSFMKFGLELREIWLKQRVKMTNQHESEFSVTNIRHKHIVFVHKVSRVNKGDVMALFKKRMRRIHRETTEIF